MAIDTSELRRGLAETWPFLLSHHLPAEQHRCHTLRIRGREIQICARCSGIYPGILAGILAVHTAPAALTSPVLVAVLPALTLADWGVTTFTSLRGYNTIRTATGVLLGYAYGVGLVSLFAGPDPRILGVGFVYGVVAGVLLSAKREI